MNTNEPQFGEPWDAYTNGIVKNSDGLMIADFQWCFVTKQRRDKEAYRAVQCVNLCAPHPDLSAVCVVERSMLEEMKAKMEHFLFAEHTLSYRLQQEAFATLRALLG